MLLILFSLQSPSPTLHEQHKASTDYDDAAKKQEIVLQRRHVYFDLAILDAFVVAVELGVCPIGQHRKRCIAFDDDKADFLDEMAEDRMIVTNHFKAIGTEES